MTPPDLYFLCADDAPGSGVPQAVAGKQQRAVSPPQRMQTLSGYPPVARESSVAIRRASNAPALTVTEQMFIILFGSEGTFLRTRCLVLAQPRRG
jgi:hypothetical protein